MDEKGKTTTLTKEQVVRGKRLFIAACASCHVGGGTRTNQNVGLAIEELSGAQPNRATVEGLVDYLNNPTTYDGPKDLLKKSLLWIAAWNVIAWSVNGSLLCGLGQLVACYVAGDLSPWARSCRSSCHSEECVLHDCTVSQDISEVHPSIKGGDIWPKMRSMKQQDGFYRLCDMCICSFHFYSIIFDHRIRCGIFRADTVGDLNLIWSKVQTLFSLLRLSRKT